VRDSLPLDVELIERIAGHLDGSFRSPRGRPRNDGDDALRQHYEAIALVVEVEVERDKLRAKGAKAPKKDAITAVANAHHKGVHSLEKLIKDGPAKPALPWREEKKRAIDNYATYVRNQPGDGD
jgi:peptidoglycan/xylan/chitin deacetylase (PgdA/CDA1 family)